MFKYLILLILSICLNAQIPILSESPFPETDFVVYASETNFSENTTMKSVDLSRKMWLLYLII